MFTESAYDGFKFDKVSEASGIHSEIIDTSSVVKIGSYNSQIIFNKPITLTFNNNTSDHWGIQNQPGEKFFPISICKGSNLLPSQNECYYHSNNNTYIITNHATIIAAANSAIPVPSGGTSVVNYNQVGSFTSQTQLQTSDKQVSANIQKATTVQKYDQESLKMQNVNSDLFAKTVLPTTILKTFEIGTKAFETSKEFQITYIIPEKYIPQSQNLALYLYDNQNKTYSLIDDTAIVDDNIAYLHSNTVGQMAILLTNYKRDILKTSGSLFEIEDETDPTLPWYTPYMRKAQDLQVIDSSDQPLKNVTRAKISDMITKLLEVELETEAENPFTDIFESTQYRDSILTLKKLGIIKGYSDSTFKPNQEVTRAEALKIVLMTAAIPSSTENSIFTDVNNEEWFTKFVMAANKLGIVKGCLLYTSDAADE